MATTEIPEIPAIPQLQINYLEPLDTHQVAERLNDVIRVVNLHGKTLEMMTKTMQKLAELVEIHDKFWKAFSKLAKEGKNGA